MIEYIIYIKSTRLTPYNRVIGGAGVCKLVSASGWHPGLRKRL